MRRKIVYESFCAKTASNIITAIYRTTALALYRPRCCATSCKSWPLKPEKPSNWVISSSSLSLSLLLSLSVIDDVRGSRATRGKQKILNPPRSLGIWREPVRKQRRGVDYDDRENNVREGVFVFLMGWAGGFPGCIAHPSVTRNRDSFLPTLRSTRTVVCADRQISSSFTLTRARSKKRRKFLPMEITSPLSSCDSVTDIVL